MAHKVYVARTIHRATTKAREDGHSGRTATMVSTDDVESTQRIRGLELAASDVVWVADWATGRHAQEVEALVLSRVRGAE